MQASFFQRYSTVSTSVSAGLRVVAGLLLNQEVLVHSLSFSESSLSAREEIINLSELLLTLACMSAAETHTGIQAQCCKYV